jgi:hypothetical protein
VQRGSDSCYRHTQSASPVRRDTPGGPVPTVKILALAGAILLVVDLYLLAMWVFGGTFTRVHSGRDQPPGWFGAGGPFGHRDGSRTQRCTSGATSAFCSSLVNSSS